MEEEKNIIVRGNDLSYFEKGFITACLSLNAKCTDICDLLASFGYERGYSCIKKFVHNLKLKNHYIPITPTKRKEKCGRKSLIGEDTGKKMVEEVKSNRMCTASQIQKNADLNHNHVSPTTVERFLNKEGYFARKMPTKPQISSANREKRLKFANDHKNWTINQ